MTKTNVEKTRELEETVKSLKAELESALKREQQLKLIIEKLKHAQFGRKSERRTECDKTLPLFPVEIPNSKEGETDANVDKASKTIEIEAHSRKVKVKSRGAEDGEAPEGTFPSDFPRQTLVIDEKPEGVADEDIELIDTKVTERLGTIPQTYYVQKDAVALLSSRLQSLSTPTVSNRIQPAPARSCDSSSSFSSIRQILECDLAKTKS